MSVDIINVQILNVQLHLRLTGIYIYIPFTNGANSNCGCQKGGTPLYFSSLQTTNVTSLFFKMTAGSHSERPQMTLYHTISDKYGRQQPLCTSEVDFWLHFYAFNKIEHL
jgi:hypothetical protein